MASSEKGSQQSKHNPGDLKDPPFDAASLRQELADLTEACCNAHTPDALCLFLRAHCCVFDSVAATPSLPHMVALNPLFARNFVSICQRFLAGDDFPDGPQLWIDALLFYRTRGPANVVRALALMAQAHILVDLPNALFQLEKTENIRIDEEQYKAVFDYIIACLESVDAALGESENVEDYLISVLATYFGVVKKARGVGIRSLRKAAWKRYSRHRALAALQRGNEHFDPPAS